MIIGRLKANFDARKKMRIWRKKNRNNSTYCANKFDFDDVEVGNYTYGPLTILDFGGANTLKIGSFCSIASGVVFNLAGDHPLDYLSTFPFKVKALQCELNEAISKGNITIDDDVWIGQNAIILSGVHICQGAVIAAGAVVTSDVLPYAVVGGIPAKLIRYRFSKEIIDYLLTLDYSALTEELIANNTVSLYTSLDDKNIEDIKTLFNWFPKTSTS